MSGQGRDRRGEKGFSLIEVAIVMVVIGLLLGGVLKGQEMIQSARSHSLVTQSNAMKAAILGFTDRYRAMPGDYRSASAHIPGLTATVFDPITGVWMPGGHDGDGNGRVGYDNVLSAQGRVAQVDGSTNDNLRSESINVWLHLANAGYISGYFTGQTAGFTLDTASWSCGGENLCPLNPYGGQMIMIYDDEQAGTNVASNTRMSNQLWTGKNLPVEIIAELDRKIDDGQPGSGGFRVGDGFLGGEKSWNTIGDICAARTLASDGSPDVLATSEIVGTLSSPPEQWAVLSDAKNCGGVFLF